MRVLVHNMRSGPTLMIFPNFLPYCSVAECICM